MRPTHAALATVEMRLLELHQLAAACLDGAPGELVLGGELVGFRALFVGVGEDA